MFIPITMAYMLEKIQISDWLASVCSNLIKGHLKQKLNTKCIIY